MKNFHLSSVRTLLLSLILPAGASSLFAQGVTTAAMNGIITDDTGLELPGANVIAVHEPSGTQYGVATRSAGVYTIPNMRIGGPYTVTVSFIGYSSRTEGDVYLSLGQNLRLDFVLAEDAVQFDDIVVTAEKNQVLNADRTGAQTTIDEGMVRDMPSVKRSIRDLTRIDPRNDGNMAFAGRNWLYNNISLDGSYFNNSFGLDDPGVGGQAGAEPIPYDAVAEVQVSVAPFDVRQGGFTGANVNTVTKSGTNTFRGSIYTFFRNESLIGNRVDGNDVVASPDLSFNQSGIRLGGPIIENKLFFFVNAELERRDDPGTDFVANRDDKLEFGESRVQASVMDQISRRMKDVYGYETGPYEGYVNETNNDKIIAKIDWNINRSNNLMVRYNYLDASRDLGPHPFVLSANNTGRGPNETSLPFQNSGYAINNNLHSVALELNSRGSTFANRFFASFNRFRDSRTPRSVPFPTIEIAEGGVTYTTIGMEPFSANNILDQDVLQLTNNFTFFTGKHAVTVGLNFEKYDFFNSFNIFRNGVFFLPDFLDFLCATTFSSLDDFMRRTDRSSDDFYDFNACATPDFNPADKSNPFKGE
ncbi:MAG: carboxypeptidase regulatory-like domain-containing protein, partial [Rhodothermia bacterium]